MRKPASVLPEPVGAATSVCSPAAMGGQAASCAGVGPSGKRSRNHAATAGCSSTDGRSVVSTVDAAQLEGIEQRLLRRGGHAVTLRLGCDTLPDPAGRRVCRLSGPGPWRDPEARTS